jgi:hypothetical protein
MTTVIYLIILGFICKLLIDHASDILISLFINKLASSVDNSRESLFKFLQ